MERSEIRDQRVRKPPNLPHRLSRITIRSIRATIRARTLSTASNPDIAPVRNEELLADVISRVIGDVRHIAVGNASPIPAMAALLARERGHGMPYVSLLQSRKHNFFADGGR